MTLTRMSRRAMSPNPEDGSVVLVMGWGIPADEYCSISAVPSEPTLKNERNHQQLTRMRIVRDAGFLLCEQRVAVLSRVGDSAT